MAGFYRILSLLLWLLGLLSLLVALLWRLIPRLRFSYNVELMSLLVVASVFFLGAIATWAMGRTTAP